MRCEKVCALIVVSACLWASLCAAQTNQGLGVIGANARPHPRGLEVERVLPGYPAQKVGLKKGDVIVAVDAKMLKGLSLTQKVTRLRGKPGTSVTVAVERKGAPKPLIITLTRAPLRPLPPLQKK
jgi:carboxyl-terminal processing protease